MTENLYQKYVPILSFARGEQFYPMAVDDFVSYSSLRIKGESQPLADQGQVTMPLLARTFRQKPDVYLQSVPAELADQNVAARWSKDVLRSLLDLSYRASNWQGELGRLAYRWLNAKTETAARLFWWNDLVLTRLGAAQPAREMPRLDLPPEIREAALENYQKSQGGGRPRFTYYHRIIPERRFLCLQYWFFYGYNDWATGFGGMNDHEGDWEGLYLFFEHDDAGRLREPPAYITYVGHHSRMTKPWDHPEVTRDGNHPVAYVAAGSHAMYPEQRKYGLIDIYGLADHATGDGLSVSPGDWKNPSELEAQPWTEPFVGAWGTRYWLPASWAHRVLGTLRAEAAEFGLPGVSAPRGPRYADDGGVRPNWTAAALWAGLFDQD